MSELLDGRRRGFRRLFPSDDEAERQFDALFRRLVTFFRLKNWGRTSQLPEDLAQETLVRGLKKIDEGADIYTDPIHYFWGVARFVAREQRRAAARPAASSLEDLELPAAGVAERMEDRMLVGQFLNRLSAEDRAVFVDYHLHDREALRKRLNTTDGALRVRVHRIRRRLDELVAHRTQASRETVHAKPSSR